MAGDPQRRQIVQDRAMTSRQLTAAQADNEALRRLYETAFPREEQIPFRDLLRLMDEMPLDCTAYYEGTRFIGFTIVYPHEPFTWFWYFAVLEELRGRGYGQAILTELISRYRGRTCILDMESPRQPCANREQRLRRQAFYLRNGFCETHVYRTFANIEYTILMLGEGSFTQQDYDAIIRSLHRFWQPGQTA